MTGMLLGFLYVLYLLAVSPLLITTGAETSSSVDDGGADRVVLEEEVRGRQEVEPVVATSTTTTLLSSRSDSKVGVHDISSHSSRREKKVKRSSVVNEGRAEIVAGFPAIPGGMMQMLQHPPVMASSTSPYNMLSERVAATRALVYQQHDRRGRGKSTLDHVDAIEKPMNSVRGVTSSTGSMNVPASHTNPEDGQLRDLKGGYYYGGYYGKGYNYHRNRYYRRERRRERRRRRMELMRQRRQFRMFQMRLNMIMRPSTRPTRRPTPSPTAARRLLETTQQQQSSPSIDKVQEASAFTNDYGPRPRQGEEEKGRVES